MISYLKLYFEIIIDSQEDARKCTRRSYAPFTQLLLMRTSGMTIESYENQEISAVNLCSYLVCVCVCVCVAMKFYYMRSIVSLHSRFLTVSLQQDSFKVAFYSLTHLRCPFLTPGNH